MSLADAQRALEIVDTRLTAIQSKLSDIDVNTDHPEVVNNSIDDIVDHFDLIIGDVRAAASEVAKHECPSRPKSWSDLEKVGDAAWSIHGLGWGLNTGRGKYFITREAVEVHGVQHFSYEKDDNEIEEEGMVRVHPKYFEHLRDCEKYAIDKGHVKPTDWEKPSE